MSDFVEQMLGFSILSPTSRRPNKLPHRETQRHRDTEAPTPFIAGLSRILGLAFKLGKYSNGVRVLARTMKTCMAELSILAVLLVMAVIIISSGIYFCESTYDVDYEGGENPSEFVSISRSMYFSMISVTTIGYGDMSPRTSCGEMVACIAGLSGIFVLGLPISIIGVKFEERYREMTKQMFIQLELDKLIHVQKKLDAFQGMGEIASALLGTGQSFRGDLSEGDLQKLNKRAQEIFLKVDTDGSGEISLEELSSAVSELGMDVEDDVLEVMMNVVDVDGSNSISAYEFSVFLQKAVTGELVQMCKDYIKNKGKG